MSIRRRGVAGTRAGVATLIVAILSAACVSAPHQDGLATMGAGAVVPIQLVGGGTFVSVRVNRSHHDALFLVDTGASITVLTPLYAKRLEVTVPDDAKRTDLTVFGGQRVSVPLVSVTRLAVGDAAVENLTVGVYDAMPAARVVDGILGLDFLKRFRMTVDTTGRVMRLEPIPPR